MNKPSEHVTGRAKGGKAKNALMTPEQRREQAMKMVQAKKERSTLVRITHTGSLDLSGFSLSCYVTSSGERLLSGRGLQETLRLVDEDPPASGQKPGSRVDRFLTSKWANSLIYKDKAPDHFSPVKCIFEGKTLSGYRAEVLADICEAMLEARDKGLLTTPRRLIIAKQCEVLMRGFMRVGIIALVDEATGYQKDRSRDELARILEAFVAKELQPWVKTFPADFYEQMFRLRDLPFPNNGVKKPQYFGHLTNDVIYRRLAPGIWKELKEQAEKDERGRLKHHLHRKLTIEIGHPKLKELVISVTTIMKLSDQWGDFKNKLDRVHPAYNETMLLPFDLEGDSGKGI